MFLRTAALQGCFEDRIKRKEKKRKACLSKPRALSSSHCNWTESLLFPAMKLIIQGPAKPLANNFIFPDISCFPPQKHFKVIYMMTCFLFNVTKHPERTISRRNTLYFLNHSPAPEGPRTSPSLSPSKQQNNNNIHAPQPNQSGVCLLAPGFQSVVNFPTVSIGTLFTNTASGIIPHVIKVLISLPETTRTLKCEISLFSELFLGFVYRSL